MYAWNSISKRGPFGRSSLPRAIAKELKLKHRLEQNESGSHPASSLPMTSTTGQTAPKGKLLEFMPRSIKPLKITSYG